MIVNIVEMDWDNTLCLTGDTKEGTSVEVDIETFNRWRKVQNAFDEMQNEMDEALINKKKQ